MDGEELQRIKDWRTILLCITTAAQEGASTDVTTSWERVVYLAEQYGASLGITRAEIEAVGSKTLRELIEGAPDADL